MSIGQLSNVDVSTGLVDKQTLLYDASHNAGRIQLQMNQPLLNTIPSQKSNSATTATDASSASTIVLRNASGDTKVNNPLQTLY
ncbi:hypothetical protein PAPYR_10693 [Paratrimastix pyriformis]|uniref:Uncharacterized protein n=1 Tax=Paratrimastix pyriformis TaxID=342808 RepID=A0ABQ8U5E7_9EUKA|nr:hypothetical protein PAPYR_10693 [Paratrimastix pyriformis]